MNKWRYSFVAGALFAGLGVAALLLGLPGVQAENGVVAVHAADYAYAGLPKTLPTGEVRFSFANDSEAESHEMTIFRINDGVSQSFDQILAEDEAARSKEQSQEAQATQPDQEQGQPNQNQEQAPAPPKMTFFASTGSAPGESAKMDLIGKLPPGRYGVVCFIPANDEAGTAHHKKGMKAEFTVE